MENKNKLNYKVLLKYICLFILYIIFCISINSFYFSQNKFSKLLISDNQKILVPSDNPYTQSFYSPYDSISGLLIYLYKSDDNSEAFNIALLDEKGGALREWEISPETVGADGAYYLSLDGLEITENSLYHMYAYSENSNPIGIVAYDTSDNGYGSSSADGYTWAYQIEYATFDSRIIVLEALFLVLCVGVYIAYKKKIKDEYILSVLYIVFALIFFIITPINSLFDEDGHFLRSYEISDGHLLSGHYENGMGKTIIPESLIKGVNNVTKSLDTEGACFLYARQKDLLNFSFSADNVEIENPNQALYSPLSYIPQVIGLLIGNLVTKNVYAYYMSGRFFAFVINTLLVLLAIKLCPERKYLIFVLASTPVFLSQMISYSADGNVNSLSIFYVAFILNRIRKEKIKISDEIIIVAGAIVLALSKVIYFPFALLVLLLEDKSFKSKKRATAYKIMTICAALICFIVWFKIARTYLFDNQNGNNVQPEAQMLYMITHFYKLPIIYFNTAYKYLMGWVGQIAGGALGKGWLQYASTIWNGFAVLLVMVIYVDKGKIENFNRRRKVIVGGILILIVLLTFSSLYVQWTSYQSNIVVGIQGRYFIPLILPLGLLVKVKNNRLINEHKIVLTCMLLELCAIVNTIQIYM